VSDDKRSEVKKQTWKEEPKASLSGKNAEFKCPECYRVEQVAYVDGAWSGLIECAHWQT